MIHPPQGLTLTLATMWVWGLCPQAQSLASSTAPAATNTGNKSAAGMPGQQPQGGLGPHLSNSKGAAEDQAVWVQQLLQASCCGAGQHP